MGSEREIAGPYTSRARDDERQPVLATAGWIRVREPAGGRVCLRAAASPPGTAEQQVGVVAPANGNDPAGNGGSTTRQWPGTYAAAGYRHRTDSGRHGLRPILQSECGVWIDVALSILSALLRRSGARLQFRC